MPSCGLEEKQHTLVRTCYLHVQGIIRYKRRLDENLTSKKEEAGVSESFVHL